MYWLTSQSVWVLVPGCLAIALAVAFVSRYLALWLIPKEEQAEAHAIASALMTAFAAAFVLLTALTLANEVTSLSNAQNIVSSEAADASVLAWSSTNPGVQGQPVQQALHDNLVATRSHEWHGQAAANGDDA
jgi:Kef-type K+ transport system membrane component KefB